MNYELEGHLQKLVDPSLRDEVVEDYREKGMGRERYGVVCGIEDPETRERCMKRICLQGWAFAVDNAPTYCLHRENYDGSEDAEDITRVLQTHGLEWRPLTTRVKMREATDKSLKKRKKKRHAKIQVTEHGTDTRDAAVGSFGDSVRELAADERPPSLFRAYVSDERIAEIRSRAELLGSPEGTDRPGDSGPEEGS